MLIWNSRMRFSKGTSKEAAKADLCRKVSPFDSPERVWVEGKCRASVRLGKKRVLISLHLGATHHDVGTIDQWAEYYWY